MKIGVLVSGSGSNLQALLDHEGAYTVAVVVSNVAGAYAVERARAKGVEAVVVASKGRAREDHEADVDAVLRDRGVDLVVLAGYMRVLTSSLVQRWPQRIVNVHPALLPSFPGMHAAKQALAHGCRVAGCTVHLVDAGVDTGPILAQAAVPILDDDTEETLQKRIQVEEHKLLPAVVDGIARGRLVVVDGRPRLRSP